MTARQFERIVRVWQKRFRLEAWDIKVDFADEELTNEASVWKHDQYANATIRLNGEWVEWSDYHANYIVAHELLHIVNRDRDVAARRARGQLDYSAQDAYAEWYRTADEGAVDRLAEIFVEIGGLA